MRQMKVNSIGDYIREQREQAKISLRQLSQAAGVSNPYLSQIERGLRKPSADILQQIAKGLRISAEALYVQAGILEDRPADSGVRSALLADPGLSERQKQVLIEIYESFRKENGDSGKASQEAPQEARQAPTADTPQAQETKKAWEHAVADSSSGTGWPSQSPREPSDDSRVPGEEPQAPGEGSQEREDSPWASAVDPGAR